MASLLSDLGLSLFRLFRALVDATGTHCPQVVPDFLFHRLGCLLELLNRHSERRKRDGTGTIIVAGMGLSESEHICLHMIKLRYYILMEIMHATLVVL